MVEQLITLLIVILVVGVIAGLVVFLIRRAPFIPDEFKQAGEWVVIAIAILVIVLRALPLVGVSVL